ncbi:tyrosine-type recombinase/integrase [Spinactinospora alkalitolerans]
MKGSTYKRCKCRDEAGRELGQSCPKLRRKNGTWNPRHGAWYFRLEIEAGKGGKRRMVRRGGFGSQEAAQEALDEAKVKHGRGRDITTKLTFGPFFDGWLKGKGNIEKSTVRSYENHGRLYLKPHLGHVELDRLRVDHVAAMFDAIEAENDRIRKARASDDPEVRASVKGKRVVGPATQQRIRATLRSALSSAVKQQLITVNVAKLVDLKAGKRPKAVVWTPERAAVWFTAFEAALAEAKEHARGQEVGGFKIWRAMARPSRVMVWPPAQVGAFLDAAAGHRLYAQFHLIAFRGLRRGESCGVRWPDVDLDAGTLTVRKQIRQLGWEPEEADTKTDASDATIALDKGTVAVLRAHRKRQLAEKLEWGEAWQGDGHVFTREDGSPLHPASVTDAFERLAFAAGLPPIRLHDLRHGAATIALAAGVDMKVVQAMLRHSSITITSDTYTSVLPEVAHEAAEASAALVPRAASGGTPSTLGLPTGSQSGENENGRPSGRKNARVKRMSRSGPPGDRTLNPRIKSPLLCQLS